MQDLSSLKYFLGIEVAHNASGLYLSQRKYALDIISEIGLSGAKPSTTPIKQTHHSASDKSSFLAITRRYRHLIRHLIYLTITRPELTYSFHTFAQFMKKSHLCHYISALRVVSCLKSCPSQGIFLSASSNATLTIYYDAD